MGGINFVSLFYSIYLTLKDLITFELIPSSGSKITNFSTKNHFNQKSDISEISNILLFTLLDWNIEIKWANPIRTYYNQSGFVDVKLRHDITSYITIFGGSLRSEMKNIYKSGRLDLRDTDKSRYFAITEFNHRFIIRSLSMFFNEYLSFCHFYAKALARRRKARFHLRMSEILFAAKHSWTTLRISRPLFADRYLQVTW